MLDNSSANTNLNSSDWSRLTTQEVYMRHTSSVCAAHFKQGADKVRTSLEYYVIYNMHIVHYKSYAKVCVYVLFPLLYVCVICLGFV